MKITVIGAGPGGYEAAIYAAECGAQVVLVEKGSVGGTCLNVGCIPTKALLAAGDTLQAVKKAKDFGIAVQGDVGVDYAAVMARKDKVVSTLIKGIEQTLAANGVELVRGTATIKSGSAVTVQTTDGIMEIETDAILIATGSEPSVPGFIPYDGKRIITSNEFLGLTELPESVLIAGGGVIGCEIGQFLARMGSKVTVIEMEPHILPQEDEDTAKALERQFRREKIKTLTGNAIASVSVTATGVAAELADGTVLEASLMLVSTGRRPYTEGLGLEQAGVVLDKRGFVVVNDSMKTNVDGIYAAGDVVPTLQLAHVATKEGFVAVDNMLGKQNVMDYRAVPRCVYTDPEVASVGRTEKELQTKGISYKIGRFDNIALGKAKASGTTDGFAKVLVDEQDRIIGAALVGAHATDMLQVLTAAVQFGWTAERLGDCIFPHPTMSEGIMEALHDVHGTSIHKLP